MTIYYLTKYSEINKIVTTKIARVMITITLTIIVIPDDSLTNLWMKILLVYLPPAVNTIIVISSSTKKA